jgi:hypothetical protein
MVYDSLFVDIDSHIVNEDEYVARMEFTEECFVSDRDGKLFLCDTIILSKYVTDYDCGYMHDSLNCLKPVKININ